MPSIQYRFNFVPRPLLKLSDIEHIIRDYKILRSVPSRSTLIEMCEDGTFEAKLTRLGWLVFEDSFDRWLEELQKPSK